MKSCVLPYPPPPPRSSATAYMLRWWYLSALGCLPSMRAAAGSTRTTRMSLPTSTVPVSRSTHQSRTVVRLTLLSSSEVSAGSTYGARMVSWAQGSGWSSMPACKRRRARLKCLGWQEVRASGYRAQGSGWSSTTCLICLGRKQVSGRKEGE